MNSADPNVSDKIAVTDNSRCAFSYSDGRRCRMLCGPPHPTPCPFHAQEELQLLEIQRLATYFSNSGRAFYTYNDINIVLSKLFNAVTRNHIPTRSATALAYIGQLLLQTLPGLEREINLSRGKDGWQDVLTSVLDPEPADDEAEGNSVSDSSSDASSGPSAESESEPDSDPGSANGPVH